MILQGGIADPALGALVAVALYQLDHTRGPTSRSAVTQPELGSPRRGSETPPYSPKAWGVWYKMELRPRLSRQTRAGFSVAGCREASECRRDFPPSRYRIPPKPVYVIDLQRSSTRPTPA